VLVYRRNRGDFKPNLDGAEARSMRHGGRTLDRTCPRPGKISACRPGNVMVGSRLAGFDNSARADAGSILGSPRCGNMSSTGTRNMRQIA